MGTWRHYRGNHLFPSQELRHWNTADNLSIETTGCVANFRGAVDQRKKGTEVTPVAADLDTVACSHLKFTGDVRMSGTWEVD